jgi:hypothetical protein
MTKSKTQSVKSVMLNLSDETGYILPESHVSLNYSDEILTIKLHTTYVNIPLDDADIEMLSRMILQKDTGLFRLSSTLANSAIIRTLSSFYLLIGNEIKFDLIHKVNQ